MTEWVDHSTHKSDLPNEFYLPVPPSFSDPPLGLAMHHLQLSQQQGVENLVDNHQQLQPKAQAISSIDHPLPQGRILNLPPKTEDTTVSAQQAHLEATDLLHDYESPRGQENQVSTRNPTHEDMSANLPPMHHAAPVSHKPSNRDRLPSAASMETGREKRSSSMQMSAIAGSLAAQAAEPPPADPVKPQNQPGRDFRKVVVHLEREPPAFSVVQLMSKTFGWPPPGGGWGMPQGEDDFIGNEIRTAKYTPVSFLPVNLMEQFTRIANLYFLLIAIIQAIPGLSPTSWFTTVLPLVFVLTINAIKEIIDDMARHRSDKDINGRMVAVRRAGDKMVQLAWRDVRVGDLVQVKCDEEFPCDLLFLKSADPEAICFVETANLDGETNLKIKYSRYSGDYPSTAQDYDRLGEDMTIRCEQPNEKLYVYEGYTEDRQTGVNSAMGIDNLLLRGSTLRKTSWVLGVAVFTGPDTKIMRNQTAAKRKVTQLEQHMNVLVMSMFGILLTTSILLAGGEQAWLRRGDKLFWYLQRQAHSQWPDLAPGAAAYFVQVLRFIILLNQLIPISLYVTLEIVKVLQCNMQMNRDIQMYHEDTDTPFCCRTTNLNEDLGQVQYVLSDKTGTLTQNIMGFVWASVGGYLYGTATGEVLPANIPAKTAHTLLHDPSLHRDLGLGEQGGEASAALHDFLLCCALANTVVPTMDANKQWVFQASSPDEEALVLGAFHLGYRLNARASDHIEILHGATMWFYDILAVLPFDSDRKRFSIVLRNRKDSTVKLYSKGADATMLPRIRGNDPMLPSVEQHLDQMSLQGYRTLCIAHKELVQEEFDAWFVTYKAASLSLVDRDAKVAETAEVIEKDMVLLGATAVEDKLQDGVPQAIEDLARAGIKLWVLTGDKVETANSIAAACRLYTDEMALMSLTAREMEIQNGHGKLRDPKEVLAEKLQEAQAHKKVPGNKGVGLTVEGSALHSVLATAESQTAFMALCTECVAVVCCRVTPMQKAQVTNLVKEKANAIVLGIGDGANDVGMIKAAHIGVGISGREGRAAVLASDYSFAQFRFLTRLLLVHGRLSYKRNSTVVLYSFYKNWTYVMPYVFLSFLTGFSSQPVFTTMLISTYNVFWTSLPIIAYAVLEQDVSIQTALSNPWLYQETMLANRSSFLLQWATWIGQASYHSLAVFFIPWYILSMPDYNGLVEEIYGAGATVFTAIIVVVNLKVALRTHYWTWINFVAIFPISIGLWFLFLWLVALVWGCCHVSQAADMAGIAVQLYSSPRYWLTALLAAPSAAILLDITAIAMQRQFFPQPHQLKQEDEAKAAYATVGREHDTAPA